MKTCIKYALASALALGCFVGPRASDVAHAQDKIKVGFVFFLSGPGAAYGIHARDGAKLIVDALNAGKVPAPYNKVGMNGVQIDPI
jgi:branched-chain amino acid transport system substrate-binding protein